MSGVHAHAQRRLEGGTVALDPAIEILLRQLVIQHPAIPPFATGLHMGIGQVAGEIPLGVAQGRVIPLHQAGEVIDGEQSLADGVGQGIQPEIRVDAVLPHREGDVHLTLAHLGQAVLGPLVTQPDPRRLALSSLR